MNPELGLLWEVNRNWFLVVTVLAAGGAWMIGRANARAWGGWGTLVFHVVLMTLAVRFLHFSLFEGSFFIPLEQAGRALYYAGVDFAILMIVAALARQFVRSRQMARQYGFLRRAEAA